jgi:enediyne biosynthesis protein E4
MLPNPSPPTTTASVSPRRRRLRWTVALLSAAAVLSVVGAILAHRHNRTTTYRPDEKPDDITSTLARDLPPDAPKPRFTDVTRAAGLGGFRSFIGDRTSQLPEDMGSGAAWGDFNNDGNDDLFLVSAGGPLNAPTEKLAPCELYENLGNGTFRKVEGFPELRIHGMGAAWGDYDGDGFLDLVVSGYDTLLLFHNEHGTGKFVRDTRFPDRKGFWAGVSWGDYDNDRNLDLYVCGYVQYVAGSEADRVRNSSQLGTSVPYTLNPSSYQPALNLLLHNNGDGTFTDVAEKLGVSNPTGRSLGALWHDFDNDGWLDLYVANDIAGSVFYHNTHGTFEDASAAAWVTDYRSAMGLTAGDYNRDGDDDLFITHWVAQENALFDNLWADFNVNPQASGPAPGPGACPTNAVPQKQYALRFMDLNEPKGLGQIALPFVGWGTEFVDFDGDGWLDLVVANGNTLEFEGPMPKKLKPQEPFLFWNRRGEYFHNIAPLNKPLSEQHVSRGLAVSDYDNDGAMDILIVQLGEGVQLLRNEMQTGHWMKVRLHSRSANGAPTGFGDGATLIAHSGGIGLRRTVSSTSYLSQSSRVVHFGLGTATLVEDLEVRWLGGPTNHFSHLEVNATWEITEGDPVPRQVQSVQTTEHGSRNPQPSTNPTDDKARLVQFWEKQRAAMNAMKVEKDIPKAIALFRAALQLNPDHEDSHYYLGNCLAMQGDAEGALAHLHELTRINPQSHRAHAQWGTLRASTAKTDAELAAAEESLDTAHHLNPEETGALLVLGEIALLRGNAASAEERLSNACRTNPKAVNGFFLRGYLAWKRGETTTARELLVKTREALGKDWQPKGATSEGGVKQKWHVDRSPLSRFADTWNGEPDPLTAFASLDQHLAGRRLKERSPEVGVR